MPEFADFTILQRKLYMGLANVERIFIAELDPVYCVVAAVLVLLVYRKTGDYRKTLLAGDSGAAAVWTGGGACQPPILEKGCSCDRNRRHTGTGMLW